jgi:hypothetical protein
MVDDIVREGEVPKDQSYWKSTLGYLYEISGDHTDVPKGE